ncbi:MAG: hypothetical protein IPK97_18630 [Ahniella sp.]|nr:hypothetical protein [Ahniella sp.]
MSCIRYIVVDKLDKPELYQSLLLALAQSPHETALDTPRWRVISLAACTRP